MELLKLRELAQEAGFRETTCPSCANGVSPECPNCGGTGRLWASGPQTLSDDGLRGYLANLPVSEGKRARDGTGPSDLRRERAFLASIQKNLYERHGDVVVVIRERRVVGTFPDLQTAEMEARIRFGSTPVLIERLGAAPRPLGNAPAARRGDVERLRTLRDALREVLRSSRRKPGDQEGGTEE